MKFVLLGLMLSLGAIQNATTAGNTIEGRVLRAGNGEPLPNTPVTLISSAGLSDEALATLLDQISRQVTLGLQGRGGGGSQDLTIRAVVNILQNAGPDVSMQASMLTGRDGHFAFTSLTPGRYTVWVQRFNYFGPILNGFPTSTTSATFVFDPSKPPPPVDLFLTQGMAISGRVLDAAGRPAFGLSVIAYRSTFSDGRPTWESALARVIDDRGEYRLAPLPPGEYYVGVTPPSAASTPAGQDPVVRTFFPGVTEPSAATKIALKNRDLSGTDFSLRTAPSTFFKISGVALNPAPGPARAGVVDRGFSAFLLMPLDSRFVDSFLYNTFYANVAPASARAAGEFEIRNVRPGIYELYPQGEVPGFAAGRTVVDVRNADAPGVQVVVKPVVKMKGQVVITNAQQPVNLNSARIVLKPLDERPARGDASAPVTEGGQFTVTGPAEASAMLLVNGLPDSAFVSDIRIGSSSVYDSGFEFSTSSEPIQVVINATAGATIETTVQTRTGRPGPRATVVLVPGENRRRNPMRYKIGTTDDAGRLVLRGVAPGAYTAFAWESIPQTAWLNAEFLAKYQAQGTAVSIIPGAQIHLQLKWIPFDANLQ